MPFLESFGLPMPKAGHCRSAIILCWVIISRPQMYVITIWLGLQHLVIFFMLYGMHTCRVLFTYGRTTELVNSLISKANNSPALGSGPWAEVKEKMEI